MNVVRWFGDLFRSKVDRTMRPRYNRAADVVVAHAQQLIDTPYPPASSPGNPPHRRTGRLQRSVRKVVSDKSFKVVTDEIYGKYLEIGTRKMKARPWLKRSFDDTRFRVKNILTEPML